MFRNQSLKLVRKITLLSVSAILFAWGSPSSAQEKDDIQSEFSHPGKQFRPMVRWWWPGADVTDEEIAREVGLLDAAGFGGAEIQPFVTFDTRKLLADEAGKVNAYATTGFFSHVRAAAEAAKVRGMWIDYTFGTGWPFGGGAVITPELSAIELRYTDTTVEGPKAVSDKLEIPQWHPGLLASMMEHAGVKPDWPADWLERFEARSKIVAVVAIPSVPVAQNAAESDKGGPHKPQVLDGSSAVILTDQMKPDGSLDWQVPSGTWHIFVFRQIPTRQPVVGAAGTGPQLVLDHLNKAAFAAHADRVGNPMVEAAGPDIGSSLRAIFCDSLELQQFIFWSDDFLDQFKKRRGYDLTPYLAILRQPGYNDFYFSHPGGLPLFDVAEGGDAIRGDYWKTVSELIFENFYHPFDEWAKQHKLLSRVQAHGAPADLLKLYGDASIPETEQLAGNNTVNFMKLASSAGYDFGRGIVSSESFVFRGNPYITTPESIKANSDKLFISGINQIVYHGFPYKFDDGMAETKALGWYPFQGQFSSQISESNPIWPFIGKVNQYITRLQYIAQKGTSDLQIAIFRSGLNEEDTGPTPANGPVKDPFPAIEDGLTSAGLSFGFVNEATLLTAAAKNATLTTNGGGSYQALVVPHETNVSPEFVRLLQSFADAKVPIVFVGATPGYNVSFRNLKQDRDFVTSGLLQVAPAVMQVADAAEAASRLAAVVRPQLRFTSGHALPFLKKTFGSTRFYFLTNPTDKETTTTVEFAEHHAPQIWDPWSGDVQESAFSRKDNHVDVEVSLPPFGSQLLAFSDATGSVVRLAPLTWTELKRQNIGDAGWIISAVGDSEKGVGVQLQVSMTKLIDWLDEPTLRTFSGKANYTTHVSISADDLRTAKRILLDLGEVKDIAEVKINGVSGGSLLVHPFAVDVRSLLHEGDNEVQVTVVNSLTNYVSTIQWPKAPVSFMGHFPPISAGLLGPVALKYETEIAKDNAR